MRRVIVVALVCVLVLSSCAVVMERKHALLLDQTATWSREVANRAAAGEMTPAEMAQALDVNADLWERFQKARTIEP